MREDVKLNVDKALELRKVQQLSYSEIAGRMSRPEGTIRRWLAPYREPSERSSLLAREGAKKGSLKMQSNYANKRLDAYSKALESVEEELKLELLRDFVNLYIGEGDKRNEKKVSIVNSDPKIIYLSVSILKKYFLNKDKKINIEIRYYKENDNEKELLEYWRNLLRYDDKISFTTYLQPTVKARGHNNSNKFGLVILTINDTYAKQKLNAYIDYIKAQWIKEFESQFNVKIDSSVLEIKKKVE